MNDTVWTKTLVYSQPFGAYKSDIICIRRQNQ